jgi:lipopolysaccharide transport system permease protein
VTTLARQRLARVFRIIGRAFVYPIRTMTRHRSLIRSMVRRDIVGRYRGSYGGLFWTVIHPLLMMATYYFVFGVVLQTRFGDDGRPSNFVLYFLAGMLPWLAFSEAAGRAPTTVWEHGNFVRKLLFPVETLPVNLVVAGLFSEVFGVAIFVAGLLALGHTLPATALYLPLILIPQFLLTLGVCWFLAALGVFFRDLGQINTFLLTVWFFTTPICYSRAAMPEKFAWLFEKNPMYVLVESYRAIFLEASAPPWQPLALLTAVSAVIFVLGHAWFYKLKGSFADLV